MDEFCRYYINEGVDTIFIVDHNVNGFTFSEYLLKNNQVKIIKNKPNANMININVEMAGANTVYNKFRRDFKWFINVDADEFMVTKKNLRKTIREELKTTFKNVHAIKVPWVMMGCNKRENDPKSLLIENNMRWNHNKKHPSNWKKNRCRYQLIGCKYIFRSSHFKAMSCHEPIIDNTQRRIFRTVDSINRTMTVLDSNYRKLREHHIKNGYILCYHYRIISMESLKRKHFIFDNKKFCGGGGYKLKPERMMRSDHNEVLDNTLANKYKKILEANPSNNSSQILEKNPEEIPQ
jgi:hypothetical protein